MKVKKITVGIKDQKSVFDDFVKTGDAIERGGMVAEEKGTYFTSFEAFRKALTPKRLELLHIKRDVSLSHVLTKSQPLSDFSLADGEKSMKRRVSLMVFALLIVVMFQAGAEASEKSYFISLAEDVSLRMTVVRFEESKHKITKCNFNDWIGVCLIDGKPVFGTDADMPEYKVVKAIVKIGAKSVALDVSCMYDPWFGQPDPKKFTVKKGYGGFIISGYFSDGAGSYEAEWLIIENSSIRMRLVHGEC